MPRSSSSARVMAQLLVQYLVEDCGRLGGACAIVEVYRELTYVRDVRENAGTHTFVGELRGSGVHDPKGGSSPSSQRWHGG